MLKRNIWISLSVAAFIFVITFLLYLDFSYMGARNKDAEEIIFNQFKWLLLVINFKIMIAYAVIALVIAGFARLLYIEKPVHVVVFNVFFWFMFWVRGIKMLPQLFSSQLYNHGGLLKYFQVFITDYVPVSALYIFFAAVVILVGVRKKTWVFSGVILFLCVLFVVKIDQRPADASGASHLRDAKHPNILIIGTDSLRPQSISYNGYHRPTQHLDKLFAKGANFLNAKTSMGRTLPTWTSILTSQFPPDHGMRHMFPTHKQLQESNWTTMADVFRANGYYTGVISDFAGDIFQSMPYGFQHKTAPDFTLGDVLKQRCQEMHYFLLGFLINPVGRHFFPEIWGMSLNKDPWYVTDYTKKAINDAIDEDKPFCLLYFSSSNHFPYATIDPYYKHYAAPGYSGDQKYGLSANILKTFLEAFISDKDIEEVRNHYDNATLLFDDNVGQLLAFLKKCNLDKHTVIIVMSDHGENLYEENYGLAHGDHLLGAYATNMVFGVYSPFEDFNGRKIEPTVRDIDIAPTILDMAKLPIPESFKGQSLYPVLKGKRFYGLPAYMETGVWYTETTPFLKNKVRLPYPQIVDMFDVDMPYGKVILKEVYRKQVVKAKYKAFQLNRYKYIYMPGEHTYLEEFYIDERKVEKADIQSLEFLSFKEKMVEMFPGKFYIDEAGFIREYILEERK